MNNKDYIFCVDCKSFIDFWKYKHDIDNTGHEKCNWRYVTDEELNGCIKDCQEEGCFNELIL